jgi:hypothetical protein
VYGLANCKISVLRGTDTNAWGDTVDNGTVAASGIPAFIVVKSKSIYDGATQSSRVVQRIVGAVGSNVDVRDTDQIHDETNNVTYAVEAVTQPLAAGLTPDLELVLTRVK